MLPWVLSYPDWLAVGYTTHKWYLLITDGSAEEYDPNLQSHLVQNQCSNHVRSWHEVMFVMAASCPEDSIAALLPVFWCLLFFLFFLLKLRGSWRGLRIGTEHTQMPNSQHRGDLLQAEFWFRIWGSGFRGWLSLDQGTTAGVSAGVVFKEKGGYVCLGWVAKSWLGLLVSGAKYWILIALCWC